MTQNLQPSSNDESSEPIVVASEPDKTIVVADTEPLVLSSGQNLGPITVAYRTWGKLNSNRSNAILVCHALTGDQHVLGPHPLTKRSGWWELMVGPGKVLDTDRYFIICSNVLGGCMGTTGPGSINPVTKKPFGTEFPLITIKDMVLTQALLIEKLGIEKLFCVIGGSMGGMQALQWAADFPEKVFSVIPIAAAARHSAQNIAFHEVGRQAIMADPDWHGGEFLDKKVQPERGLAVARMAAHITYLSETALHKKFGRDLQDRSDLSYAFDADFQVESYLRYQGESFVNRFDANSYLYITRAMDYFDLAKEHGGVLSAAFQKSVSRFCLVSFTSDWLYPTAESREIVRALNAAAANVSFVEVDSDKGHDAFLLDEPDLFQILSGFLNGAARHQGIAAP
tara:strand:+ start:3013 stop:4203 length:1191 start_codon:yes stop_codon:yes gene_type:complete